MWAYNKVPVRLYYPFTPCFYDYTQNFLVNPYDAPIALFAVLYLKKMKKLKEIIFQQLKTTHSYSLLTESTLARL